MSDLRLSLAQRILTRDGTMTKDALMVNFFREDQEGKVEAVKRAGYTLARTAAVPGAAQGTFTLNSTSYGISGDTLFTVDAGIPFAIPGVISPGEVYDIISNVSYAGGMIAVLKSLYGMWYFNGIAVIKVTDVDYPSITVRGLVLIDGTYYVMDSEGIISGSGIEDPTSWSALNFIGADQTLGTGVRLHRHLNYCFALNDLGSQAFYNAANPAPGSPLAPAGNATFLIGCASGDSVVSLDDLSIFVSKAKQRGRSVSAFQGLSLICISTPFVDKVLNRSTLAGLRAFGIKLSGHGFYVLALPDLNVTLVCDLLSHDWSLWTSTEGTAENYFKFAFYLNNGTQDLIQHISTGALYAMSPSVYQDNSAAITCRIRTAAYDGQTSMYKFFTAIALIGDQVSSTVSIRNTNDDYQTYSAYRTVDMSGDRRELRNLGRARRKAFELLHTDNSPLRLEAIEFELYLGVS